MTTDANAPPNGIPSPASKHAHDGLPLEGVILCCTSIPPEQRDTMAQAAREMGATTRLDLTKDVTHLIVGAVDTPKYRYVAKERPDIRVVLPSWLDAVRKEWTAGDDVDVRALARKLRMPTLWSLIICVTGFSDVQERSDLQDVVEANGAEYHGDLTKNVTHLIAAAPSGKKYEYAGQWGVKIVAIEWLRESLRRGMILNEALFSPILPVEQRGIGATTSLQQAESERVRLGKRKSLERPSGPTGPEGKRKLRRTASSKLESQHSGIWDDMGSADAGQACAGAEWEESKEHAQQELNAPQPPSAADGSRTESQAASMPTGKTPLPEALDERQHVFVGCALFIFAFEARQESILKQYARMNGAELIDSKDLATMSTDNENVFCVVPWDLAKPVLQEKLAHVGLSTRHCSIVTNHWMEACIFTKSRIDPDELPVYRPLRKTVFSELPDWTITPTSFEAHNLLHFSKAVRLTGATYDEYLKTSTSVLVVGPNGFVNREKLGFAFDNGIPVVNGAWFWSCLESGEVQDVENYLVVGKKTSDANTKSEKHSSKDSNRRDKANGPKEHETSNAPSDTTIRDPSAVDADKNTTSQSARKANNGSDEAQRKSQPLREPTGSESNSQRQPESIEPIAVLEKNSGSTAAAPKEASFMFHEDDESQEPARPPAVAHQPSATQQSRRDQEIMTNAIDQLRAHAQSTAVACAESTPSSRRHRKLGRAQSNPSSLSSRTNSIQHAPPVDEANEDDDDYYGAPRRNKEEYQPSQALMYEHEEGKLAREKLLRRTIADGSVDEDGMRRVESIGRVTDAVNPKFERKASTRRGATR